jgi:hypothetical protein
MSAFDGDPPLNRALRGLGQPAEPANGHRRRSPSPSLSQHPAQRQLPRWPLGLVRIGLALSRSEWSWLQYRVGGRL